MTITARCHCGKVEVKVENAPEFLGDCNCSICRRYKALWGYYPPEEVSATAGEDLIDSYIWGDRQVLFQRCHECGCVTHYVTTDSCPVDIVGINFRMVDPALYKGIKIKPLDNA